MTQKGVLATAHKQPDVGRREEHPKSRGKKGKGGNVHKADGPGEKTMRSKVMERLPETENEREKLVMLSENEKGSLKLVEVTGGEAVNDGPLFKDPPLFKRMEGTAPRNSARLPRRRMVFRRAVSKPSLSCSGKVFLFTSQCLDILLLRRDAEARVLSKIQRSSAFVRAHLKLFTLEVSSLTMIALWHPTVANAIAKLIWLFRDGLQTELVLSEVIKTCNLVLGINFEAAISNCKPTWKYHGCCIFFAELVAQMKKRGIQYGPFLRIFIRFIHNLLKTGNMRNIICAKNALKISSEVLMEKRPEEFAVIFSTLEHLLMEMNDQLEDKSLFHAVCVRGFHGRLCGCAQKSSGDGKEKQKTEPKGQRRQGDRARH